MFVAYPLWTVVIVDSLKCYDGYANCSTAKENTANATCKQLDNDEDI